MPRCRDEKEEARYECYALVQFDFTNARYSIMTLNIVVYQKVSPPAPLWSKTSRWRERIKAGHEVEVRQTASLAYRPKWYRATVIAVRRETDVPMEIVGGAELEMIGEDNKSPLKLLNRKRQVLVKVPQEKNNCTTPAPEQLRQENGNPVVHPPYTR